MFERFNQHIIKNFPFLLDSKLLIAVSGGVDSVVLTHLLSKLGVEIALAHVNFHLRGNESDQDEAFVSSLAKDLQLPFFIYKADTKAYAVKNKLSIQMAAREIRYDWFAILLKEKAYDYILIAHHLDDAIETFFINLSRSSGLEGLIGIPQKNDTIIRPLLPFTRDEIVLYANKNNKFWREDASNKSTKYLRNKIRHQLLPILQDIHPEFRNAFLKSQSHLRESHALVKDYIVLVKQKIWEKRDDLIYISLKELAKLPNYKAVLYELLKVYNFTEWNDVYGLVRAQTGKQIFSNTHFLLKNRMFLVLGVNIKEAGDTKQELRQVADKFRIQNSEFRIIELPKDVNTSTEKIGFKSETVNEIYFDKSKVILPLFVRKWKKGDYFYPLGMKGKKKLSNFFIDQKITRVEKEKIWLLCDADDHIIWIIGYRSDDRFKITNQTTDIIKIIPVK